jgi:hypothetical protein
MQLSKWDDYLIHQVVRPIATLGTDDPNFMDRIWFMAYSADGSLQMMAGLGTHPNKGIMDGFLLVRHDGTQHNLRLSRHVDGDKDVPEIGPLRYEIVAPQKHWRIHLGANDQGLECELDFHHRTPPFLFPPLGFSDQGQLHYKQPGHCTGTITINGEVFQLAAVPAVRDRSWGIRKPGIVSGLGVLVVIEAHFPSSAATLIYLDTLHDDFQMRQGALLGDDGSVLPVLQMRQAVTFDPANGLFDTVTLAIDDAGGRTRTMLATAVSEPCYFTGGGYDGRHGRDYGPMHQEGEAWDVANSTDLGGVFPYYSRICRFEMDGEVGIGHVEAFFSQEPGWNYQPTLAR